MHGRWRITWRIHNLEKEALTLRGAQVPHEKFRSEQRTFDKAVDVPGDASASLEFPVICREAPGTVVDNAFLILHVDWRQNAWRIFVRFQVSVGEDSLPHARTESITTQKAGFSADRAPGSGDD